MGNKTGYFKTYRCENCGKVVTKWIIPSAIQHGDTYRYCSKKCSGTHIGASRKKLYPKEFICEMCHTSFIRLNNREYRFCSNKCVGVAKRGVTIKTAICEYCKKPFSGRRANEHKYCSQKCWGLAQTEQVCIKKTCPICNKIFKAYETKNRKIQIYCSNKCKGLSRRKDGFEKRMKRWQEYGKTWQRQKTLARQRDNDTCRICGKHREKGSFVDVHHIVPIRLFKGNYKKGNNLNNLIVLCRYCHFQVELNKISCPSIRSSLFTGINLE